MIKGLFCGVSKYRFTAEEYEFCRADAISLKQVFVDTFIVDERDIKIIAENGQIENNEYIRELKNFSLNCQEEDLAVIYFSGHGDIDEQGYNYLMATNTLNEETRIYFDVIIDRLRESKAKSKLVILDCCHAESKYGTQQTSFDVEKAVSDLYQSGISVFASCRSNEKSYPYYGEKTSAFTQFLCDAIKYTKIYREDGLYVNDIKLLVERYAEIWSIRNPERAQTPVFHSNMIGTIIFPLRHPKVRLEKPKYNVSTQLFDIIDLEWEVKRPKDKYQKIYVAKIIANASIEKNVFRFIEKVVNILLSIHLPVTTSKQWITLNQPIDVIQLWIGMDCLDIEERYFKYRAVWERDNSQYWCNNLGTNRIQHDDIAYIINEEYERSRENRLKFVLPDYELRQFWDKNIRDIIIESEQFIKSFRDFENKEITFDCVQKEARIVAKKLSNSYESVFQAWFPLPGSELREFNDLSHQLVAQLQGLVYLCSSNKSEKYIVDNYKIDLANYYQLLNSWYKIDGNL